MRRNTDNPKLPLAVVTLGAAFLAGCSGGGNTVSGGGGTAATQIPAQFVGQTDLVYFAIDGDTGTSGNYLSRFAPGGTYEASITVVDGDTIELTTNESGSPEVLTFNYDSASDRWVLDSNSNVRFRLFDAGDLQGFALDNSLIGEGFAVNGAFGIQTATMPGAGGSATYSTSSFSRVLAREDGADPSDLNVGIVGSGGVNLSVDFGDGNAITGTVFNGNALVDLDSDNADDDRLSLQVNLSGTLSGSTFSGTVSGGPATGDIDDDGTGVQPLTLTLTNTDADGAFFGNNAAAVAGNWEAEFDLSDGATSITGDIIGVFDAERD